MTAFDPGLLAISEPINNLVRTLGNYCIYAYEPLLAYDERKFGTIDLDPIEDRQFTQELLTIMSEGNRVNLSTKYNLDILDMNLISAIEIYPSANMFEINVFYNLAVYEYGDNFYNFPESKDVISDPDAHRAGAIVLKSLVGVDFLRSLLNIVNILYEGGDLLVDSNELNHMLYDFYSNPYYRNIFDSATPFIFSLSNEDESGAYPEIGIGNEVYKIVAETNLADYLCNIEPERIARIDLYLTNRPGNFGVLTTYIL